MNVDCDHLEKGAPISDSGPWRNKQLLLLEKAAVFVNGGEKLTSDVEEEVLFYLGKEETGAFYTAPNTTEGKGLG